ncbi:MAG TPA: MFS transporter, partial [Alteromonas macleodii]|nr:MFS transporter [Alteromonas macleodii]
MLVRQTMPNHDPSSRIIRWLTYLMFMMFAMTSDSVGEIIKEVKVAFSVTNAQASLMHSLPMLG